MDDLAVANSGDLYGVYDASGDQDQVAHGGADGTGSGDRGSEEPGSKKRKRNRKPVTCAQCRKRKLKCDREFPCSACVERSEGHLCEWEGAIRLPPSNYTRDQEAQELRSQLDRLEGLLSTLGSPAELRSLGLTPADSVGATARVGREAQETSAAEALGLLSVKRSFMVNPQENLLITPVPKHAKKAAGGGAALPPSHLMPSSGKVTSIEEVISLLPQRLDLDSHVTAFLSDISCRLPSLFHVQMFLDRYCNWNGRLPPQNPSFIALLSAMVGWNTWQKTLDTPGLGVRNVKEQSPGLYFDFAMEVLHLGRFLERPSLDTVRTLIVILTYRKQNDEPTASFLLQTSLQIAQVLGLHRDPFKLGTFAPWEAEERRRLWLYLSVEEATLSVSQNGLSRLGHSDTLPPINSLDEDLNVTFSTPLPVCIFTPISSLLHLSRIANLARAISDTFALNPISPTSWSKILQLNSQLVQLETELPSYLPCVWSPSAVKAFSEVSSAEDYAKMEIHLALRREFIRLHRPFLARGFAEPKFAVGREKCCWAARYNLGIFRGLGEGYRAARVRTLTFHATNALLVLAVDLWLDPTGAQAEFHRADITSSLKILHGYAIKSKLVTEGINVVEILLRRASTKDNAFRTNYPPLSTQAFDTSIPFKTALPLPMSAEPFISTGTLPGDAELVGLWEGLRGFGTLYALPDHQEWAELCKAASSGRYPWQNGLDLL